MRKVYKVLIVDDEEVIRNGINHLINWESLGCKVCATAANGIEGLDIIRTYRPEIVITDLKMPGKNGMELIAEAVKENPRTKFIVLSGYEEFDFAKEVMKYGIKYYLLKPCDEDELVTHLKAIVAELDESEQKDEYLLSVERDLKKMLPQAKEQFLRECVLGNEYSEEELDYYRRLFGIEETTFKIVVLKVEGGGNLKDKFALRNIADDKLGKENIYLSAIIAEEIILLVRPIELSEMTERMQKVKKSFFDFFKRDICIGISNDDTFSHIRQMYTEVQECLKCEFYLEGKIASKRDIVFNNRQTLLDREVYDSIADSVKTGNVDSLKQQLDNFFDIIKTERYEIELVRTYCIELLLNIVRMGRNDETEDRFGSYYKYIQSIGTMDTLGQIRNLLESVALRITARNYEYYTKSHNIMVGKVIDCINKNKDNPKLSLNWVAKEVLFMNENYLGKLFMKETGEKFSQYVVRIRMEKAKELLRSGKNYKMYEIARKIGFEENTQYFSQVFKKYSGVTPSEFAEKYASGPNSAGD